MSAPKQRECDAESRAEAKLSRLAFRRELAQTLRLAFPLALLQGATHAISSVGLAVVGLLPKLESNTFSPLDAAAEQGAVGLGTTCYFVALAMGLGAVLGFDPLISQALGAGDKEDAKRASVQAMWSGVFVGILLCAGSLLLAFLLPLTSVDTSVVPQTQAYVLIRAPTFVLMFVGIAARAYLQARDLTRPLLRAAFIANIIHVPIAWLLVLGDPGLALIGLPFELGLSPMGAKGAAISAAIASSYFALDITRSAWRAGSLAFSAPDLTWLQRGFKLGLPLALQLGAEVGSFAVVSFAAGTISSNTLAAHHVALALASITFQLSLALNEAASVRVGLGVGRASKGGDVFSPRRSGFAALLLGGIASGVSAIVFWIAPEFCAGFFTSDPEVLALAIPLIQIAACFQLVDGAQSIGAGALRGIGDTRVSMLGNLVGHFGIGLPIGLALAFVMDWGAQGLWWGLSLGLAAVAVLLVVRFEGRTRHGVSRL